MKNNLLLGACLLISSVGFGQRYLTPQFSNVTVTKNVVYGKNYGYGSAFSALEDLKMDVYLPDGDTASKRPVIIFGHAGSYLTLYPWGIKEQYSVVELCTRFAKLGYVAVSIDYRLGWSAGDPVDKVREKTIINAVYLAGQDYKTAIRYFKKDAYTDNLWKADPCKVFIAGTNSGGYSALAAGNLDKTSELSQLKFLDAQGQPYINQAISGDFEGYGGTKNYDNHKGYSNKFVGTLALGAATGDTTWVEAGDPPVVAFHGTKETTTPYNKAIVITSSGTAIIEVFGSGDFMPRHERLGNNNVFNVAGMPVAPKNGYNDNNNNFIQTNVVNGLYPLYGEGFEPWSWYDGAQPVSDPDNKLNPGASQTKGMKYIDTIMAYTAPRFNAIIEATASDCVYTVGIEEANKIDEAAYTMVPNPASNTITVFTKDIKGDIASVTLFDVNGRAVKSLNGFEYNYAVMNVEDVPNGMYFLQIANKNGAVATKKAIIQR